MTSIQIRQQGSQRLSIISRIALFEPIWTWGWAGIAYLAIIFQWDHRLAWLGLACQLAVLLLKGFTGNLKGLRSALDVPIVLFLAGAVLGTLVSDRSIRVGAIQTTFAMVFLYYSALTYPRPALLLKLTAAGLCLMVALGIFWAFSAGQYSSGPVSWSVSWLYKITRHLPGVPQPSNLASPLFTVNHGLVLLVAAGISFLAGIALFAKNKALKVFGSITVLLLGVLAVLSIWASLGSLFKFESFEVRMRIWSAMWDKLPGHWLTGLGYGSFPLLNFGAAPAHNSYLEAYANAGVLGALAVLAAVFFGVKMCIGVVRAPRDHPWYGAGFGLVLAIAITAITAFVESSPVAIPLRLAGDNRYQASAWMASPIIWFLGIGLVLCHRILCPQVSEDKRRAGANRRMT